MRGVGEIYIGWSEWGNEGWGGGRVVIILIIVPFFYVLALSKFEKSP